MSGRTTLATQRYLNHGHYYGRKASFMARKWALPRANYEKESERNFSKLVRSVPEREITFKLLGRWMELTQQR
jgi:hypothetical protein